MKAKIIVSCVNLHERRQKTTSCAHLHVSTAAFLSLMKSNCISDYALLTNLYTFIALRGLGHHPEVILCG